jgi:hypothetical protein
MDIPEPHGQALVICPHFDDACFSVGGLLLKKSFDSVAVLTVFSRSNHATNNRLFYLFSKFADSWKLNSLKRLIVNLISLERKKEDSQFCRRIGATQSIMFFEDSSLRGCSPYCSLSESDLFSDPLFSEVVEELQKWVLSNKFSAILCPLAVGDQVDHVIILYALLHILKKNPLIKSNIFFYEDLPYSVFFELNFISDLVNKRLGSQNMVYINVTETILSKKSLINIYRSQAGNTVQMLRHAQRLSILANKNNSGTISFYERLWKLG